MDRPEARPTERKAAGLEIADVEVAGMTDDRLCLVLLAQTENAVGRIDIAVAGIGTSGVAHQSLLFAGIQRLTEKSARIVAPQILFERNPPLQRLLQHHQTGVTDHDPGAVTGAKDPRQKWISPGAGGKSHGLSGPAESPGHRQRGHD